MKKTTLRYCKMKKTLEDYTKEKEGELLRMKDYVSELKKINLPLEVFENKNTGKIRLSTSDYSLAENVEIDMSHNIEGDNGGDYGDCYQTHRFSYYPVFTFGVNLNGRREEVFIDEEKKGFYFEFTRVRADGIYSEKRGLYESYRKEKEVLEYYLEKGVSGKVLGELQKKMREPIDDYEKEIEERNKYEK